MTGFDRAAEWQALAEFAADDRLGAALGMVSGRRRQGKTLLLESMCEELGGLYLPPSFTTIALDKDAGTHMRGRLRRPHRGKGASDEEQTDIRQRRQNGGAS